MAKILYVGRFELPDREATANRVVANAKLLRDLGHEVILAGWSSDVSTGDGWKTVECYGFESYEKHKADSSYEKYKMFSDASPELKLLKKLKPQMLIAYDFPAVALGKLMKYCKKEGIKVVGDVSEWYTNGRHPIFRYVRAYDSYKRMKVLHKKMDGLIVISRYLEEYYKDENTVLVPPLVDISDEKWSLSEKMSREKKRLVYAGWPSKTKERLDLIVDAVASVKDGVILDIYGVTEEKYREIYDYTDGLSDNIVFHGRVSHKETLSAVKNADFSLIIRGSCRKNNAGFPSKLVESIACGTPVLVTDISNVSDHVGDGKNGFIVSAENLVTDIQNAISRYDEVKVDRKTFDYRNYAEAVDKFLKGLN